MFFFQISRFFVALKYFSVNIYVFYI